MGKHSLLSSSTVQQSQFVCTSSTSHELWFSKFTGLTAIWKSHCAKFRISVFSAGPGRYHRGPPSGGDPPVSRVLPSLLLSSPLPHTPPPPLSGSSSLHPQLFLSPCQPRRAASSPVLPAPPSPHVRRSRYCHVHCTRIFCQIIRSFI